jgi:hypothetical protein
MTGQEYSMGEETVVERPVPGDWSAMLFGKPPGNPAILLMISR